MQFMELVYLTQKVRYVKGVFCAHKSYFLMPDHKLVSLKVPSLQYRRWREDVILMYKIILG